MESELANSIGKGGVAGLVGTLVLVLLWSIKANRDALIENTKAVLLMGKTITRMAAKLDVREAGDDDQ